MVRAAAVHAARVRRSKDRLGGPAAMAALTRGCANVPRAVTVSRLHVVAAELGSDWSLYGFRNPRNGCLGLPEAYILVRGDSSIPYHTIPYQVRAMTRRGVPRARERKVTVQPASQQPCSPQHALRTETYT
eukprot:6184616-Pleurochrysis_carterae.AAC.3